MAKDSWGRQTEGRPGERPGSRGQAVRHRKSCPVANDSCAQYGKSVRLEEIPRREDGLSTV